MTQYTTVANNTRHVCCPLCRAKDIFKVGSIQYGPAAQFSTITIKMELVPELWSCMSCNSRFVQNIIPENIAIDLYAGGASMERWSHEPFEQQKPANQLECLRRYFGRGKRVLDVGCNTGELLDFAKSLGCHTSGVEYSDGSRDLLAEKNHATFFSISAVTGEYDVITAFDLVEHLYDIQGFFIACRKLLKQGGALIILTGNIGSLSARLCGAKWWYLKYPEHIVFPSKQYFAGHSGFRMSGWISTYASRGYLYGWSRILFGCASGLRRGDYSGLPSIGPDHVLAILE